MVGVYKGDPKEYPLAQSSPQWLQQAANLQFRESNSGSSFFTNIASAPQHAWPLTESTSRWAPAVSHMMAARWLNRFKDGSLELEDEPRSGRPPVFDLDALKVVIEEDSRQSRWCLAERLGHSQSTVLHHLHDLGYRKF